MKFKDRVIIKDDFYENKIGILLDKRIIGSDNHGRVHEYLVQLHITDFYHKAWIHEEFLIKVEV